MSHGNRALSGVLLALLVSAASASDVRAPSPNQLGTPAKNDQPVRTVKIAATTKYVNAEHFETVIIESHRGQRFSWMFDTQIAPTGFPLRRIAPPGFDSGNTWVYVDHPARHVAVD